MSPSDQDKMLPLPQQRSPQELDDKILGYAREHAPRRRSFAPGAWTSALAAAGIAGVALLIALPPQTEQFADDDALREAPAASAEATGMQAPARLSSESFEPVPAQTAKSKAAPAADYSQSDSLASPPAAMSKPPGDAAAVSAPHAAEAETRFADEIMQQHTEVGAAKAAPPRDDDRLNAVDAMNTATAAERALFACRAFLPTANEPLGNDARECYARFKLNCEECELPETLEEALISVQSKNLPAQQSGAPE